MIRTSGRPRDRLPSVAQNPELPCSSTWLVRVCRSRCQSDSQPERSRRYLRRSEAVVQHSRKRNQPNRAKQLQTEPIRLNSSFVYLLLLSFCGALHDPGTTVILILHGDLDPGTVSHSSQWSARSEEHTSELQSLAYLVCRLL